MSEPVTLYRDGDEVIVTDPTYAGIINRVHLAGGVPRFVPFAFRPGETWRLDRAALADGWSLTDDYVPFAFRDEFDDVIANPPFGTVDTDAPMPMPQMNVTPAKRGRPRKAQM